MWNEWNHMGLWRCALMIAGGLLSVVLVLAFVVLILRYSLAKEGSDAGPEPSARELLDRRLARGEIDVDDYPQWRDALTAGRDHHHS